MIKLILLVFPLQQPSPLPLPMAAPPIPEVKNEQISLAEWLYARELIIMPPGSPITPVSREVWIVRRKAIMIQAINLGLMDELEAYWEFRLQQSFPEDVDKVRRLWQDCKNLPPISDAYRFPDPDSAWEAMSFNSRYRQHVKGMAALSSHTRDSWQNVEREALYLYKIWDTTRDATNNIFTVARRRRLLQQLREMIGDEAYRAGMMPPSVPIWRFYEVK